jgi:hypothetical protein
MSHPGNALAKRSELTGGRDNNVVSIALELKRSFSEDKAMLNTSAGKTDDP